MKLKKLALTVIASLSLIISGCSSNKMSNSDVLKEVSGDLGNIKTAQMDFSTEIKSKGTSYLGFNLKGNTDAEKKFAHFTGDLKILTNSSNVEMYMSGDDAYLKLSQAGNMWIKQSVKEQNEQLAITSINGIATDKKIIDLLSDEKNWEIKEDGDKYIVTSKNTDAFKKALQDSIKSTIGKDSSSTEISFDEIKFSYELDKKSKDVIKVTATTNAKLTANSDTGEMIINININDINKAIDSNIPDDVKNSAKEIKQSQ